METVGASFSGSNGEQELKGAVVMRSKDDEDKEGQMSRVVAGTVQDTRRKGGPSVDGVMELRKKWQVGQKEKQHNACARECR